MESRQVRKLLAQLVLLVLLSAASCRGDEHSHKVCISGVHLFVIKLSICKDDFYHTLQREFDPILFGASDTLLKIKCLWVILLAVQNWGAAQTLGEQSRSVEPA